MCTTNFLTTQHNKFPICVIIRFSTIPRFYLWKLHHHQLWQQSSRHFFLHFEILPLESAFILDALRLLPNSSCWPCAHTRLETFDEYEISPLNILCLSNHTKEPLMSHAQQTVCGFKLISNLFHPILVINSQLMKNIYIPLHYINYGRWYILYGLVSSNASFREQWLSPVYVTLSNFNII
jgi:hypothetical protein